MECICCADKNQHRLEEADEKFKEISNAYEVLSDQHERAWCVRSDPSHCYTHRPNFCTAMVPSTCVGMAPSWGSSHRMNPSRLVASSAMTPGCMADSLAVPAGMMATESRS